MAQAQPYMEDELQIIDTEDDDDDYSAPQAEIVETEACRSCRTDCGSTGRYRGKR